MADLPTPSDPRPVPTITGPDGARRTMSGTNYGDVAQRPGEPGAVSHPALRDPSRGSAMERDVLPPDADFSRPPAGAGSSSADALAAVGTAVQASNGGLPPSREERIRRRAHARYEQRGGAGGDAESDWLAAEAEIAGEPANPPGT